MIVLGADAQSPQEILGAEGNTFEAVWRAIDGHVLAEIAVRRHSPDIWIVLGIIGLILIAWLTK